MSEQAFHVLKKTSKGFMCLISYFSIFGYIAQKMTKTDFQPKIVRQPAKVTNPRILQLHFGLSKFYLHTDMNNYEIPNPSNNFII